MKERKANSLTKKDLQDIGHLVDGRLQAQKRDIYDRIGQLDKRFNASQAQQTEHFEKLLTTQLAEHHDSLIDAIETVVINDRIKPLELRVTGLEARKI